MPTAPNPVHQPRLRLHRAALAALLALALVCIQSLGLWHRLVHPGPGQLARVDTTQSGALFTKLFAQHHGDPDCQFFDHASHGDAIGAVSAVAVASAIAPRLIVASHGLFVARWHAQFQARGPPSFR